MADTFRRAMAAQRGTELHAFAAEAIRLGIPMKSNGDTLNMYVNDAIGFRMTPEQPLYYSENCFGTADAISFRRKLLRIHDLKTGEGKVSFDQLVIYAALFCHEYEVKPNDIKFVLRIYQMGDILEVEPELDEITHTMDKIREMDAIIRLEKEEFFR